MTFSQTQIDALSAKLDGSTVKTRKQGGRNVSYIEGWHAIAEANRIFGFDAWDRETVELRQLGQPYKNHNDNVVVNYVCRVRITVRAGGTVIVREGCGFGSGIDKDEGQAHESAAKEAETDAMKRGLMTFGNPFGLALYDKTQEGVAKEPVKAAEPPKEAPSEADRADAWIAKAEAHVKKLADRERIMQWTQGPTYQDAIKELQKSYPDKAKKFLKWFDDYRNTLPPAQEAA